MNRHFQILMFPTLAACFSLCGCRSTPEPTAPSQSSGALPAAPNALSLPVFEQTPEALRVSTDAALADADAALTRMGRLTAAEVNFDNTLRMRDDIVYGVVLVANRASLIKETSTNPALRDAATVAIKRIQEWAVGIDYRQDVYGAIRAFADQKPALQGEDARMLEETMRDYRRAGLALPEAERAEVERLRKELSRLTTDFSVNVTQAEKTLKFSRADLDGVPESFLSQPGVKSGDDEFTIKANVTWHFVTVMENAKKETTRRQLKTERFKLAEDKNLPLLKEILRLRADVARRLGYASWADYQIEVKMAGKAATARAFLVKLKDGLQPKFDEEIAEFKRLKARQTGEANPKVELWDWRYYSQQLAKEKYNVDSEQLRVFFATDRVLDGMFRVYERIFSLKIQQIHPPYRWVDGLRLYLISDSRTGEMLGALYMDLYPREGKFNHFAQFDLIPGKLLRDGRYQRPTAALVCNFPAPTKDEPSLLSYQDVQTIFHEFGHALHTILTQAKYARFSGTSVPGDFVEAPSQMLENWARDKTVLDGFAVDYRDPNRKIPAELLKQIEAARLSTIGMFYRRQITFGLIDLTLHGDVNTIAGLDPVKASNAIYSDVFFPVPKDTAFVAYFGHLMGYDGGYYGYAWADAISADMATVFRNAPDRFLDAGAGLRLRNEIYAPGGSRDVNESIQAFLGRKESIEPFLQSIGISGK